MTLEPCPYTVGRRVCVAGPRGHAGPHEWPKHEADRQTGRPVPLIVSPFVRRAQSGTLPASDRTAGR